MMDDLEQFRAKLAEQETVDPIGAFAVRQMSGDYPSLHDAPEDRQAAQDARARAYLATMPLTIDEVRQRWRFVPDDSTSE